MKEIDKLDNGLRVAIYGAGEYGLMIKDYIKTTRPDIYIFCFFDRLQKENIDGIKVLNISKIQKYMHEFDKVIIASYSNRYFMEIVLKYYGINNYVFVESLSQHFILKQLEDNRMNEVLNLFPEEGKKVFELVVRARKSTYNICDLVQYILNKNNKKPEPSIQYLDFINKDSIKTVISGGAYDGATTLQFRTNFKNIQKIYAFEPLYDKFKCEIYDKIIQNTKEIEIIQKGLFDKSTRINFDEHGTSSKIKNEKGTSIEVVSIDDFVESRKIKKIDFIKMDIEGSEISALNGAKKTIQRDRPQMAISIYHLYDQLFDIPLLINKMVENYTYNVYHYSLVDPCETIFYAIPKELVKNNALSLHTVLSESIDSNI